MLLTSIPTERLARLRDVRALTETLASRLSSEDQTAQSMTDASPTKWHRAHTSWFFEEFILSDTGDYTVFDPTFRYLFNSYYEAVGARHPRPQRGLVTRPGAAEIGTYRRYVEQALAERLESDRFDERQLDLVELGCHHEQQHQELLLMDAKHLLAGHPFDPVYVARDPEPDVAAPPLSWRGVSGGDVQVGHDDPSRAQRDGSRFAFDNEGPRHVVHLEAFE